MHRFESNGSAKDGHFVTGNANAATWTKVTNALRLARTTLDGDSWLERLSTSAGTIEARRMGAAMAGPPAKLG